MRMTWFPQQMDMAPDPLPDRRKILALGLTLAVLVVYLGLDALAPRGVLAWQASFALVCGVTALAATIVLTRDGFHLGLPRPGVAIGAGLLLSFGLLSAMLDGLRQPVYVLGDAGLIGLLVLYILFLPSLLRGLGPSTLLALGAAAMLCSLVSLGVARMQLMTEVLHGARYDGPRLIAIAALTATALCGSAVQRWASLGLMACGAVLAWGSGWRGDLVLLALGVVVYLAVRTTLAQRIVGLFLIASAVLLALAHLGPEAEYLLIQPFLGTRFAALLSGQGDLSLTNRVLEVRDVLATLHRDGTAWTWLFGSGHGAVFWPILSYPEPNVTEDGLVHNIHITAAMMLFRYGLLGLGCYLAFAAAAIWALFRLAILRRGIEPVAVFFTVGAVLVLARSLVYTPLNDPPNMFLIAGFLLGPRAFGGGAAGSASPLGRFRSRRSGGGDPYPASSILASLVSARTGR